jgi:hypothetical protein
VDHMHPFPTSQPLVAFLSRLFLLAINATWGLPPSSAIHAPLTTTTARGVVRRPSIMARVAAAHLLVLLAAAARVLDVSLAQTSTDYDDDGTGGAGEKGAQVIAGSPIVAGVMNERLKALTSSFAKAIGKQLDYCIKDTWVHASCSSLLVLALPIAAAVSEINAGVAALIAETWNGTRPLISRKIPPSLPIA